MTVISNDLAWWLVFSNVHETNYFAGSSWCRAKISLDLDGAFVVASFTIVAYDWSEQDNVYRDNC